jgi:hypothetical protein
VRRVTLVSVRRQLADSGETRPRAAYRDDLVTAVLGAWFSLGLFLDAWAHNNLRELESFFTPWHAVFYSGFAATAGWICWLVWRNRREGTPTIASVPVGYVLAAVALPVFALAGAGDYLWHTVFGIEQELRILFSPTHLVLVTSMILIITSPLRSAWADGSLPATPSMRQLMPAVLTLAFATSLVLLFLQYANALVWSPGDVVAALSNPLDGSRPFDWASPVQLVSSVVVTNVVLLVPLLLLAARWRVPTGTATIIFAAVAGLAAAISGLRIHAIPMAVLAVGVGVDLLLAWLRPSPSRRHAYLAFGTLAPLLTWTVYLVFASLATRSVPTVVEYWTGLPVVCGLLGLVLSVVVCPPRGS